MYFRNVHAPYRVVAPWLMSKQGDSSYCFFRSLDSQDRFLPRPSCLLDCNQGVGKWQLKIPFPARKFVFLFPPQNLINLSEVLSFCKFVLFLSVSSLCLFPQFFFTFPILAAIFCFFFVIFVTLPSSRTLAGSVFRKECTSMARILLDF